MDVYEAYGRLALAHEQECRAHLLTIDLLRRVAAGEVALDRVSVTDNAWNVEPPPEPKLAAVKEKG